MWDSLLLEIVQNCWESLGCKVLQRLYWIYFWGCCFTTWIYEQMGQASKQACQQTGCFVSMLLTLPLQTVPPKCKLTFLFALTNLSRIAFFTDCWVMKRHSSVFSPPPYILCAPSFSTLWSGIGPLSFKLLWIVVSPLHSGFSLLICELHDYPQLEIHFCNHIAISCIFRTGFFQPLLHLVPVVLVLNRNLYLSTKYWVLASLEGHKNHSPSHIWQLYGDWFGMARGTIAWPLFFHEWASQTPLFSWGI